jgi:histidinol phosphatase-like PHP family hydrolase
MKQDELNKRNSDIALMLGYINTTPTDKDFNIFENEENLLLSIPKMIETMSMQFHSNWNWLLEAVEFVEKIGETNEMYGTLVEITTTYVKIGSFVIDFKLTPMCKKQGVFIAVSDFAKKFNNKEL